MPDSAYTIKKETVEGLVSELSSKANDQSVVHKTNNETIDGNKCLIKRTNFNSEIDLCDTADYSFDNLPATTYNFGSFRCSLNSTSGSTNELGDGVEYTRLQSSLDNNGVVSLKFSICNPNTRSLTLYQSSDGTSYGATLETTIAANNSINDNNIPTIGWVNDPSKSINLVHRSSNETIAGNKTFTNPVYVVEPNENSDDTQVPTTSWVNTKNSKKQDTLVSGTNIKTINSESVLGNGNISVQVPLVSGTNIKTINSESVLGNGNISVQVPLVSGTNIKTINSESVLGSGNISIGRTVVQTQFVTDLDPTDTCSFKGYRLWSDGLLEQFGEKKANTGTTVSFLLTFKDTNYIIMLTPTAGINALGNYGPTKTYLKTVSKFEVHEAGGSGQLDWYAIGYFNLN